MEFVSALFAGIGRAVRGLDDADGGVTGLALVIAAFRGPAEHPGFTGADSLVFAALAPAAGEVGTAAHALLRSGHRPGARLREANPCLKTIVYATPITESGGF